MSKIYSFLLLLISIPALSMERPPNYQAPSSHNIEEDQQNFCELEKELFKIIDEEDGDILDTAIYVANKYRQRSKSIKKTDVNHSVDEIATALLEEKIAPEPKFESLDAKNEPVSKITILYQSMTHHEEKLREILKASTSINDSESIKKVLAAYQKWYPYSPHWISDIHELTFNELTKKFGFHEKLKQMALEYKTAGSLTWLSKQKIACQTIPVEKLNELIIDARMALHNCDEPKTVALIGVLNKTSFKECAREALFKALAANIITINSLKNRADMATKIINRIHILGHAHYNFKESCNQSLMQHALQSGFPNIVSTLEHYGMHNPARPLLPFYRGEKPMNEESIILEKIYAKKDTEPTEVEFTWTDKYSGKKKSKFSKKIS